MQGKNRDPLHVVLVLESKALRQFFIQFTCLMVAALFFLIGNTSSKVYAQNTPQEHQEKSHNQTTNQVIKPEAGAVHSTSHEADATPNAAAAHSSQQNEETGHGDSADKHTEEKSQAHGTPSVGYIGLENGASIDENELKMFKERVTEEAMAKGKLDQIRFIFFALTFLIVCLAFAKNKTLEPVTKLLHDYIDWRSLGTVTGIILIVLVIPSGIMITFFYMPTSTEVYSSVEYMTVQPVLAFFRNLHNWSSEVFIWLMLLHAARSVSTRTFLGNRKFIWLAGAVASAIGWVAFLSGSFMRGDQEALEGFIHMMYSFTLVPGGKPIAQFFSGELTLIRLTTIHIIATIFIMGVFLALHVLMRKIHTQITHRWKTAVIYSSILTILMVVQSILMEAPFIRGLAMTPTVSGVEYTKPPWPIYFLIQGENWFGANAMVAILTITFLPLIVFPYVIELLPLPNKKKDLMGEVTFYIGVFLLLLISYIGAAGQIKAHIF